MYLKEDKEMNFDEMWKRNERNIGEKNDKNACDCI